MNSEGLSVGLPSDFLFLEDLFTSQYPEMEKTRLGIFQDLKNKRTCVIKRLSTFSFGPLDVIKFKSVLEKMKSLNKKFIVQYFSVIQTPEHVFLVMEHLPMGSLKERIGHGRAMKEEDARFYVACLILGLEFLHCINIVHNDVSVNNVVLERNGYPKLVDFDSARVVPSLHPYLFTDLVGLAATMQDLLTGYTLGYADPKSIGNTVSTEARSVLLKLMYSKQSYDKLNCRMCLGNVSDCDFFKGFNWYSLREGTLPAP